MEMWSDIPRMWAVRHCFFCLYDNLIGDIMKYILRGILVSVSMMALMYIASCKPVPAFAAPAEMNVLFEMVAPGDHRAITTWTAVSDIFGAPDGFTVTARVSIAGGAATTLPGYPKNLPPAQLADTLIYTPTATQFGAFVYTVEVRQVRRGLTGAAATASGTLNRVDQAPLAPGNIIITVTILPRNSSIIFCMTFVDYSAI